MILCDDCRIYYKKYGKLPATDETREPPPYMFKVVVERELRDEDGYVVNGKLALRSRRAIPPVQTTLRSGRNKTASPVEGIFKILRSLVTSFLTLVPQGLQGARELWQKYILRAVMVHFTSVTSAQVFKK